ncbi:MAG: MerR family transcriptional regulator [Thermoleophilaceae bacterium]|nr:MerR family transcriptional regulator [Thermoleophilaceae bacterium]
MSTEQKASVDAMSANGASGDSDVTIVPREKALTIGAVRKTLEKEFGDVSISKIRYLEDQKLLTPKRTEGGYRVYTQDDVARLRTILRLQRDEYLPLRVIRQELSAGRSEEELPPRSAQPARGNRRFSLTDEQSQTLYAADDVLADTGAPAELVRELIDFGLVNGSSRAGATYFDQTEREIIRAVTELARYGVSGRNLRVFKTSADREAALLEQIFAPALRSRSRESRGDAVEALENLTAVTSHLKHLLLVRDLRRLVTTRR